MLHRIIPIRGLYGELSLPQVHPTPLYIDSASTVFVATNTAAPKKSVWIMRRVAVLAEGAEMGEITPIKISEEHNFADPMTKYVTYPVYARHRAYANNAT